MGGASTATAHGPNSVLYNPALASPRLRRYSTGITLATVGGSVADREEFIDAFDEFDDSNIVDRIEVDLRAFNDTFGMIRTRIDNDEYNTSDELQADIDLLSQDLNVVDMTREELKELVGNMSDKPVTFELRGSGAFGTRIGSWGTGLHYQSRAYGGGAFLLDDADFDLVDSVFGEAAGIVGCLEDAADGNGVDDQRLQECRDLDLPDEQTADNFLSEFQFQGAVLSEFGLTLARDFNVGGRTLAVGFTPKQVEVSTYDYIVRVQDEDDVDIEDREQTHSNVNLDLGFAMPITEQLRIGASIRNLLSQSYGTVEGNEIRLEPQVRVGVSYDRRFYTLAADLDLTENRPMGFGPETRFLALGGELHPLSWLHLRAGYRFNLASSDLIDDVASVGFGLSPGPLQFDVGVAGNDNEVAGYLQFGFVFGARHY
ncbi:conjugal transfer protein TraF [Natronospira bacteriovora]|uniref:Conjugal transfer protein TraF n=1 Tax=Natronospira bacteriovora TaxID=3069753 RepID=A0ABU0W5P3_9GAMM|nr:conjugal transfer protein TraF [Natronospira sp. AB-CW4]MDQ2069341.1 conjugal transfer protein TraF [Natronospira sp. AB-CW4]